MRLSMLNQGDHIYTSYTQHDKRAHIYFAMPDKLRTQECVNCRQNLQLPVHIISPPSFDVFA